MDNISPCGRGLARIAQWICCREDTEIILPKDPANARRVTDRNRNRHQSIIRGFAQTPSDNRSEPKPNFASLADRALKTFGRSKAEVAKALSATADPKAVAREAVVLVMVGLPARGKSYISGAILRHLRLLGVRVRTFNAGELRREAGKAGIQADFFSASNKDAKKEREQLAMQCCDNLLEWMRLAPPATSSVGILDATNTTKERRQAVLKRCFEAHRQDALLGEGKAEEECAPLRVIFLESLCDDEKLLQGNYKMKLRNDDYKGTDNAEAALTDFQARVQAYEAQYEPLEDGELDFADGTLPVGCVRTFNGGQKLVCCRTNHSIVAAPFISLLHAMHLTPRKVFLAPQAAGGGGVNDAKVIADFLKDAEYQEGGHIDVICGASKHAALLAQQLELLAPSWSTRIGTGTPEQAKSPHHLHVKLQHEAKTQVELPETPSGGAQARNVRTVLTLRALEPRSSGVCGNGSGFEADRLESYADLVRRMRSEVLLLIERLPRSVLVVCPGEDVRRVLLAHFMGCTEDSIAEMTVPEGKVIQLTRDHKGFSLKEVDLPRDKPRLPKKEANGAKAGGVKWGGYSEHV